MNYDILHLIVDVATPIAIALLAYVGLMIKNTQATVKADLLAEQISAKQELTFAHATTQRELEVHIARDEERFDGFLRTLSRIDAKIDTLSNRRSSHEGS